MAKLRKVIEHTSFILLFFAPGPHSNCQTSLNQQASPRFARPGIEELAHNCHTWFELQLLSLYNSCFQAIMEKQAVKTQAFPQGTTGFLKVFRCDTTSPVDQATISTCFFLAQYKCFLLGWVRPRCPFGRRVVSACIPRWASWTSTTRLMTDG